MITAVPGLPLDTVLRGDCVEVLRRLPDRCVDLVILDPPYWKVAHEDWDFAWRTEGDYAAWCLTWLREISRVSKRSASLYLFGYLRNLLHMVDHVTAQGFVFRQPIIIDKGLRSLGGRATRGYKQFPNVTEMCLFFVKDARPFVREFLQARRQALGLTAKQINDRLGVKSNGGGVWSLYTGHNILAQVPTREMWERLAEVLAFELPYAEIGQTFNIEMGLTDVWTDLDFYAETRIHPTQKPVALIERLIYASSDPGMVVLDPFLGSGSSALAALRLGRHYLGIELEAKYADAAVARIAEEQARPAGLTG